MINYTLEDLNTLREIIEGYLNWSPDSSEWKDALEESRNSNKEMKEILLDFFGRYFCGIPSIIHKETGLIKLLFETPCEEMPLYAVSDTSWEQIIGYWRLKINK